MSKMIFIKQLLSTKSCDTDWAIKCLIRYENLRYKAGLAVMNSVCKLECRIVFVIFHTFLGALDMYIGHRVHNFLKKIIKSLIE